MTHPPRHAPPPTPTRESIAGLGCLSSSWILATARDAGEEDPRIVPELIRVDPYPRAGSPRCDALCLEMRMRVPASTSPRTRFWIIARPSRGGAPPSLLDVLAPGEDRRLTMPDARDPTLLEALERVACGDGARDAGRGGEISRDRPRGPWRSKLLAHRPGRRAAVRFLRGEQGVVVKILRGGRAERLARRVGQAHAANPSLPCLSHSFSKTTPGWIYAPFAHGMTLHASWTDLPSPSRWSRVVAAARVLAAVHATEGPSDAPPRGLADALGALDRPLGILEVLGAPPAARIRETLQHLLERTQGIEGSAPCLGHGDIHDKQFLFTSEASCVLLDWDGIGKAPREEDLANFRAHLRLRALQGLASPSQAEAFERGFVEETHRIQDVRGGNETREAQRSSKAEEAYLATALARLAAVYALRPRWSSIVEPLCDTAERVLDGLDE